jgi:hypothetical protein
MTLSANDTQHKWHSAQMTKWHSAQMTLSTNDTQHKWHCSYAECHYAKCRYARCRYADCHYAECCYAQCNNAECRIVVSNYQFLYRQHITVSRVCWNRYTLSTPSDWFQVPFCNTLQCLISGSPTVRPNLAGVNLKTFFLSLVRVWTNKLVRLFLISFFQASLFEWNTFQRLPFRASFWPYL